MCFPSVSAAADADFLPRRGAPPQQRITNRQEKRDGPPVKDFARHAAQKPLAGPGMTVTTHHEQFRALEARLVEQNFRDGFSVRRNMLYLDLDIMAGEVPGHVVTGILFALGPVVSHDNDPDELCGREKRQRIVNRPAGLAGCAPRDHDRARASPERAFLRDNQGGTPGMEKNALEFVHRPFGLGVRPAEDRAIHIARLACNHAPVIIGHRLRPAQFGP